MSSGKAFGLPRQYRQDRMERIETMMTVKPIRWLALLGCSAAMVAAHAAPMSKEEASAEKSRIEADYKSERKACDALAGNAKDVCVEQAKGKEKVARAELDYKQDASPRHRDKVAEVRADADYSVAKEKCDDLSGDQKDVCVKDAKAAKAKAEADIKTARKASN
jgi:hypothetical protein